MALIFAVDTDTSARIATVRALAGLSGVTVLALGSLVEAQSALALMVPHVVLMGVRDRGAELLDLLPSLRSLPELPRILLLAEPDTDIPDKILCNVTVLEEPVQPQVLGSRVLSALRQQMPSSLFSLTEYLQIACLGRRSLVLLVTSEKDSGYVMVRDGEVWAAQFGGRQGALALYAMINCASCIIESRPWLNDGPPRQLTASYEELLFEAAIRQDTAARAKQKHELAAEGRKSMAAELVTRGVRAVIDGNYANAVQLFVEAQALDPRNASIRHRLERLSALGYPAQSAGMGAVRRGPRS